MKKRRLGRPPSSEGRVKLNLTVPPYVEAWLKRTGNASQRVRELVDAARHAAAQTEVHEND
jgi:hypothetical protein